MTYKGRFFAVLTSIIVLTGCGSNNWKTQYSDMIDPEVSKGWRVTMIDVQVPTTLTVSEDNAYAPDADIVWRGDPRGNRYQQIDSIVTEAAELGVAELKGGRSVQLVIVIRTFHALTERTRYALKRSGVHNIEFTIQVIDAKTGVALSPIDEVHADLVAYTGNEGLLLESQGQTQKVRIIEHVSKVIAGWMGPGEDVRGTFVRTGR